MFWSALGPPQNLDVKNFSRLSDWLSNFLAGGASLAAMLEPLFVLVSWQQTPKASLMVSHLNLARLLVEVALLSCHNLAQTGSPTNSTIFLPFCLYMGHLIAPQKRVLHSAAFYFSLTFILRFFKIPKFFLGLIN